MRNKYNYSSIKTTSYSDDIKNNYMSMIKDNISVHIGFAVLANPDILNAIYLMENHELFSIIF